MAILPDLEIQIKAEAWQGIMIQRERGTEGNTKRYNYRYALKDSRIDDPGNLVSDLTWLIRQDVLVTDEGGAGEEAYFEGPFIGPLYNAYLRWLAANIAAPQYAYRQKFLSTTEMEFTLMDVGSGYAENTTMTGRLVDGELVVT